MKTTRLKDAFAVSIFACMLLAIFAAGCSSDSGTTTTASPNDGNNARKATFSINDAVMLQTLDSSVRQSSSSPTVPSADGRALFRYEIVGQESSTKQTGQGNGSISTGSSSTGSNLLAIDAAGNAKPAIDSEDPIRVLYTVKSPDGKYVYVVLGLDRWKWNGNNQQYIAKHNCAFIKVRIADNSSSCVAEGLWVQEMDDAYHQAVSGSQKPIQFDDEGNLFFSASTFTRDCHDGTCFMYPTSWNPRLYKIAAGSGDLSAITHDNQSITHFLVLPTGEIAYQSLNTNTRKSKLYLQDKTGGTINLSSSNWGVDFFTTDTNNTVIWGQFDPSQKGLYMARPLGDGSGKAQFVKLDTHLFGSAAGKGHEATPRRIIVADDGNIYGVFESWHSSIDSNDRWHFEKRLTLFQVLPYDGVPKLQLTLGNGREWWGWMDQTPFQIAQGYVLHKDSLDKADGYGKRDIIQMTRLADRDGTTLLQSGRYKIFKWLLHNNKLVFSGVNQANNIAILGEIDIAAVKSGKPESEYLTLREMASAKEAFASVQDIEMLTPEQQPNENGKAPQATILVSPENLYSSSIRFTKRMNRAKVEENLTYRDATVDIPNLKLWVHDTLHMVPDLDGLLDMTATTPLNTGTKYTIALGGSIVDKWGRALAPVSKTFTTKPGHTSWWSVETTDTTPFSFSSGKMAKYAGPQSKWKMETYDTSTDFTENVRVEFSTVNQGLPNFKVVLWNRSKSGLAEQQEVSVTLDLLSRIRYRKQGAIATATENGFAYGVFGTFWSKYRIDIYGSNVRNYYFDKDTSNWKELNFLKVDDYRGLSGNATILLRMRDVMALDNLKITSLNGDGTVKNTEGDIQSENFDGGIPNWLKTDKNSDYGFNSYH